MPVISQGFITGEKQRDFPSPVLLVKNGPIMSVEVAVPSLLAKYLTKKKLVVPQPVKGYALIDSGASTSCVDSQVIKELGVKPIGVATVLHAGGSCEQNLYPARFDFLETSLSFEFDFVMGANLREQSIMGENLVVLIGRDVLSRCIFVYNGASASYMLAV